MRVNFFEEFPLEQGNLETAAMVEFPSTIYLAAKCLDEFKLVREKLARSNPKLEAAYWPILEKSYFVNPFAYPEELEALAKELKECPSGLKVLIDNELPLLRIASFPENYSNRKNNVKFIGSMIHDFSKLEFITAEMIAWNFLSNQGFKFLGFDLNEKKFPHKKIRMYYSSLFGEKFGNKLKERLALEKKEKKENLQIAFGTMAKGVYDEPIISSEQLDRDFEFAKENGFDTITLFRLGGLNKEYLKVIGTYL